MTIAWQNGSGNPKRVGPDDWAKVQDFIEIVPQINRRRLLEYRPDDDALDDPFDPALWMTAAGIAALRDEFTGGMNLIHPPVGGLGGQPPSPDYMRWLWPEADDDENKLITLANPPPSGEVNFFAKMNGGTDWTDGGLLSSTWIRAVHTNEFRWACERLSRGRWKMPIYFSAGIIHHTLYNLDDTPWIGGLIAKSVWGDLRTIGFAQVSTADSPKRGLWNVQVRPTSRIWLVCDADCTVEVGRVTTNPISYVSNPPTWNNAQPGVLPWITPGGDFQPIGTMTMVAGVPNSLTGQAVADAIQTMIDAGSHFDGDTSTCSFLVRKVSDSFDNVATSGSIDVEFDLAG